MLIRLARRLVNRLPLRRMGLWAIHKAGPEETLRAFTDIRRQLEGDPKTHLYSLSTYRGMAGWVNRWSSLEGKRILEFGPGWSLGHGALFVSAGAQSYVGADLFPLATQDAEHYRLLRDELDPQLRARFDAVVSCSNGLATFDESRLSWRYPVDAAKTPFDAGSFDIVLSNATLEHVRDPEAVVKESLRVLAPGGLGFHQVDFRDHRDFDSPLDFLRHSPEEWARVFDGKAFEYTNRWRLGQWTEAFMKAGAEVLAADVNLCAQAVKDRSWMHADFRDRDDLETLGALIVVRRTK